AWSTWTSKSKMARLVGSQGSFCAIASGFFVAQAVSRRLAPSAARRENLRVIPHRNTGSEIRNCYGRFWRHPLTPNIGIGAPSGKGGERRSCAQRGMPALRIEDNPAFPGRRDDKFSTKFHKDQAGGEGLGGGESPLREELQRARHGR